MKIQFSIKYNTPKEGINRWIEENKPVAKKLDEGILAEYLEVVDEFKEFLNSDGEIVDKEGKMLRPIDVYNAVEYYKVRIRKLLLMLDLKLYKTHNVNKDTQVRYIVMRAFWIDDKGKPFRYFSKNLGAENKVLVNGKIPIKMMESVEDYIKTLMWDLYWFEYIDDSVMESMDDSEADADC